MGASERRKGRNGQYIVKLMLVDRDWIVAGLESGTSNEDLLATDTDGVTWAVEVKNTKAITPTQRDQAKHQAKKRKVKWMLASHIANTSSWLIQRQGKSPCVWHEKVSDQPGTLTHEETTYL